MRRLGGCTLYSRVLRPIGVLQRLDCDRAHPLLRDQNRHRRRRGRRTSPVGVVVDGESVLWLWEKVVLGVDGVCAVEGGICSGGEGHEGDVVVEPDGVFVEEEKETDGGGNADMGGYVLRICGVDDRGRGRDGWDGVRLQQIHGA